MSSSRPRRPKPVRATATTLFEHPRLYDLAFGFRDVAQQCDGLLALARRYGTRPVRSVVELCCGPARHLRELRRRGLRASGVDLNREMLAYARNLGKLEGIDVELLRADMRTYTLPKKADLVYCLFDSFCHNTTDADAIATLRASAATLHRGGLFIAELTHPADFFAGSRSRSLGRWTRRHDGVVITARFEHTEIDPVRETFSPSITIEARYDDGRPRARILDRLDYRIWTTSGLRHVAAVSGCFDIVGWHGDLTPDVAFDMSEASWQMIVVMRKR